MRTVSATVIVDCVASGIDAQSTEASLQDKGEDGTLGAEGVDGVCRLRVKIRVAALIW